MVSSGFKKWSLLFPKQFVRHTYRLFVTCLTGKFYL